MSRKESLNYEAAVILNATLSEEETEALIERLSGILTQNGANLKETARWGKRKLAYPIAKKTEGYYVIYYFTLDVATKAMEQLIRTCRFDENVFRCMCIKVPDKKRGQEVAQLVPTTGWMADFKVEPRSFSRGRGGPRPGGPPRDRPRPPAPETEAVKEAAEVKTEEKPEAKDAAPVTEAPPTPEPAPAPVEAPAADAAPQPDETPKDPEKSES